MTGHRPDKSLLIELVPGLLQVSLPVDPEPGDLDALELWIKRADNDTLPFVCDRPAPCCGGPRRNTGRCGCWGRNSRWLLRYPAFNYQDGKLQFRLDNNVHHLPAGSYTAEVRDCGKACYQFELYVPGCRAIGAAEATGDVYTLDGECPDAGTVRDDVDDTFKAWLNFRSVTLGELAPDGVYIQLESEPNPAPAEGSTLPELVITDGVAEEWLQLKWVNGTFMGVIRASTNRFLAGSCVRFDWTPNNLEASGYKNPNFIECEDVWCCGTMDCDEGCS